MRLCQGDKGARFLDVPHIVSYVDMLPGRRVHAHMYDHGHQRMVDAQDSLSIFSPTRVLLKTI